MQTVRIGRGVSLQAGLCIKTMHIVSIQPYHTAFLIRNFNMGRQWLLSALFGLGKGNTVYCIILDQAQFTKVHPKEAVAFLLLNFASQ